MYIIRIVYTYIWMDELALNMLITVLSTIDILIKVTIVTDESSLQDSDAELQHQNAAILN